MTRSIAQLAPLHQPSDGQLQRPVLLAGQFQLLGDDPRLVSLGDLDEICVQLQRADGDDLSISARVSALRPEPHGLAVVKVAGPDISPGTYRSTPWGLLLRVMPENGQVDANVRRAADAPVCQL